MGREGERRGEKGSRGGYFSHPILSKYPMNNADGYYIIGLDQGMILFFEKGDMAELVDATDLIELSLGMETYQVIASKSREPWDILNG